MSIDAKINHRLDELIALGRTVLRTRKIASLAVANADGVDVQLANQWLTSCLSLLSRVFGDDSPHCRRIKELFPPYVKWVHVEQAFGVLLAAKDDFESESIFSLKALIEAEVFDEFLDQAEHLNEANYFQPAAVIAGCVLEDGLRKLCQRMDIELPVCPKLEWMNSELAKNGLYDKLTQKRITVIADLRNKAAHGKWSEFEKNDVNAMIRDVRDFMLKYFS